MDLIYESGSTCAVKRNPYLVEFEAQRSQGRRQKRPGQALDGWQMPSRTRHGVMGRREDAYAGGRQSRKEYDDDIRVGGRQSRKEYDDDIRVGGRQSRKEYGDDIRVGGRQSPKRYGENACAGGRNGREAYIGERIDAKQRGGAAVRTDLAPVRQPSRRRAARRRRMALVQRALVGLWVFCILVLAATLVTRNGRVSAGQENDGRPAENQETGSTPKYSGYKVQGLPAEEFAKHPAWTEDFLTVNEYSRPGDPLEGVKNIFVHYTANPGTSAAQNRSYFEWLKDTHETSASAHFIIGYEGEIIQCVPLDEIAYAVQSRNGDSVSIECCYLEQDGSFTQETYDSLISLLAWLVDVYDLETEDILRHYDCGGKKCPLYYTENPDEWEELKKDVDKL